MKSIVLFLFVYSLMLGRLIWLVFSSPSPENVLVGNWKEVSWVLEKGFNSDEVGNVLDDHQKEEICKNLVIHKAEQWRFDAKRNLFQLTTGNKTQRLMWNVKGRGHVLEIKHGDLPSEEYQIQKLDQDSLILHLNFDLQVRGVVKMTFAKTS